MCAAVTCIVVQAVTLAPPAASRASTPSAASSASASSSAAIAANPPLVLVGRVDGSLDLFQLDQDAPLQSWQLANFIALVDGGTGGSKKGRSSGSPSEERLCPVVYVSWCPLRPSSFIAVDQRGNCFLFDLLENQQAPVVCTASASASASSSASSSAASSPRAWLLDRGGSAVSLSRCPHGSTTSWLAMAGEAGQIRVRPLWEGWQQQQAQTPVAQPGAGCGAQQAAQWQYQQRRQLLSELESWAGRTAARNYQYPGSSSSSSDHRGKAEGEREPRK